MPFRALPIIQYLYLRWLPALGILAAAALPLKLPLAYIFLLPAIAIWLTACGNCFKQRLLQNPPAARLVLFFVTAAAAAAFGINPPLSWSKLAAALFYSMTVLLYCDLALRLPALKILGALLLGQSAAAFYSLIESACGQAAPRIFVGTVSESGQLALSLTAGIGAALSLGAEASASLQNRLVKVWLPVNFALFILLAFAQHFGLRGAAAWILVVPAAAVAAAGIAAAAGALFAGKPLFMSLRTALLAVVLPLLAAALLANLKRGPWVGALLGGMLLLWLCRRKYLFALLLAAGCAAMTLPPVWTRLTDSSRDFFIHGGRSVIWNIGSELLARYPLGIGYKNSGFLREFAPEIPPELQHFHNTPLNVLVETGWLGLLIFIWWLAAVLRCAFAGRRGRPPDTVRLGIGCAVAAWITAGMVEYNFGDSEVVLVLYLLVGILAATTQSDQREAA